MNLINCEACGVLFDKDVLVRKLKKLNDEGDYLSKTTRLNCPLCKSTSEFDFYNEDV